MTMTAKQLDLFDYLNTTLENNVPSARLLEMLEAVDGIRHARFDVSDALGGCADLLAGEPEGKDRVFNRFVHKVGRAIKPVLLRIDQRGRVSAVREAAMTQGWFDGGLACLDEIREFAGVKP